MSVVFKSSLQNKDVNTASSKDMSFDSDKKGLGIAMVKFIRYTFPDNPSSRTLTYKHGMNFKPAHWGMYKASRGFGGNIKGMLPWIVGEVGDWQQDWNLTVDDTNFYLTFAVTDFDDPWGNDPIPSVQGETFEFKIYITGIEIT